jgi:protein-S-isoprenylcysteine O-methyltransferase Ste14
MLALFLLNLPHWFTDWQTWYQILSWILLVACILPLWFGVRALKGRGQPDARQRAEPELMGFERTTRLVTGGVYNFIRHPLYSSLLILTWGIFFKILSGAGLALALVASLLLIATARSDEAECIQTFGPEYREYMQRTRMFIPYLF